MYRYFIHLAYNGSAYVGWQIQPNGQTIQAELQNALGLLLKQSILLIGCGRTDAGVHASSFYAHFDSEVAIPADELVLLTSKLNSFLGDGIVIFSVFPVCAEAHARFDAISRTYQYHLALTKMPFKSEFVHRIFFEPDIELMNEGAKILFDYEDFTTFSKLHTQTKTNNCNILYVHWERAENELIFTIKANRFLRNMVRAITGTLLDLGWHKITLQELRCIIESKDRGNAGTSMPAKALFLTDVEYDFKVLGGDK